MSFSQELKDFTAAANAGMQIGNQSAKNAAEQKHYEALEKYYDARTPDDTPAINQDFIGEGHDRFGPGGAGTPSAVPTEPLANYDPSKAPTYLAETNKKYGALPPDYLTKTAWIENKFQPRGGPSTSSAGGLFQFTDGTAKQYGLTNKNDPLASTDAAARYAVDNAGVLRKVLGRAPTGAELYLAHQQGATGAAQLLRNPNVPAISIVGRDAVINNGGSPNMTAGEFANLWLNKYNKLGPHAACGGMIHRYESGGAVSADVPRLEDGREDMTNRYNTQLSPQDEDRYMAWLRANNRDNDTRDYDMRGAWVENAKQSDNGHFPDTYKKPNHPTFSTHSKYHGVDGNIGGEWGGEDGAWTYTPSETNLKNMSPAQLQEYFRRVEPNSKLLLPPSSAPHYADGGAVDQQKPYYAEDLMNDVNGALGKLGDVVRGGFQSIADTFGLGEKPAVAQADPDYMKRVESYARDPGADPQQVQDVKRTVDPDGQLDDALATTYGMVKSYEYHLKNGNQAAANKAAGQILLYTRMKSQQLGAIAVHALQEGDETTATKAIQQAYNFLPNSQKLEMQDGKAILVDQKSGKPIREVEFTPATLLKAAYGFTNGEAFLNDLSGVMQSEKEKVAGIKAQSAIDVANANADAKTDAATITTEGRKDVAHTKAESAVNVANIGADVRRDVAGTNKESHLEGIDKQQTGENQRNAATNQTKVDVANVNQGGANYRAGVAADTSTANNKNTNETNERIAGVRVEGQKDVANTRAGAAVDVANINQTGQNQRTAATNETRKDIAEGRNETSRANNVTNNQTKMQTTMDILDAKGKEGDANRQTRKDIAAGNNATSRANTGDRIASADQRNINTNQTRRDINANNNATSRANTQDKIDAAAANTAIKVDADQQKAAAANQENDRRVGRKAALTRQGSQLTLIDKMTNHALLGVDETTTPNVSASQAQATRNIARGIVEGAGGKVAGDEAASYARQMTKWDPAAKRPKVQLKLNPGDNSVTMPDGVTLSLSPSAFQEVARIHGGAQ